MSDPLSRLGSLGSSERAPDLDAIKLRAHRIRRRRQTGLASAGAAAMAVIAVVGVLLATGPGDERGTTSLAEALDTAGTPTPAALEYRAPSAVKSVPESQRVSGGSTTSGAAGGVSGASPSTASRSDATKGEVALAPAADSEAKDDLTVTLEVADQMIGRGKTFTLKACNSMSETVTREFGTSQRYDFEVSDADGRLVWRWSDGMFFTQVVGEETWKARECKEWSEDWDGSTSDGGRAPAGDYTAVGVLEASPETRTARTNFSLSAL